MMSENSCSQSQPILGASRSIYYSLTDNPILTEEEKIKLESVMKRALEFEEEEANRLRQPVEGVLCKYTNVMKGWQYRWFILTPDSGMLEYHIVDEKKKDRPRGGMHLAGATVLSSEEDSLSFVVNAVYGEVYKLKASDAVERQTWVDRIRLVIEKYGNHAPEVQKSDSQTSSQSSFALCKSSPGVSTVDEAQKQLNLSQTNLNKPDVSKNTEAVTNSLSEINESVTKALECQKILAKSIEDLPISGKSIKCSDSRLLLIKATSQATVQSLEQCYLILRRRKQRELLKRSPMSMAPSVVSLDKIRTTNLRST